MPFHDEDTYVQTCGAVRRKLEDACWLHAHCRRWRRGHDPGRGG